MDASGTGLEIASEHPRLSLDLDVLADRVARAVRGEGFSIEYLGVILTGRDEVHELNRKFLGHDYPTDVVSFPLSEEAAASQIIDGEVYVDLDTAAERAPEFDTDFETEATRYVIHGVLHLMGYDDTTPAGRAQMSSVEGRYLAG
jgi:probable rRNA maturation factor